MNRRLVAAGGILVVLAAVALWMNLRDPRPDVDDLRLVLLCPDGHASDIGFKAFRKHQRDHWATPYPCGTCGKECDVADRCPHCGHVYRRPRDPVPCPQCDARAPEFEPFPLPPSDPARNPNP